MYICTLLYGSSIISSSVPYVLYVLYITFFRVRLQAYAADADVKTLYMGHVTSAYRHLIHSNTFIHPDSPEYI